MDDDEKVDVDGMQILIERRAAPFAAQSLIDFVDSMWGRGFSIRPVYGGGC